MIPPPPRSTLFPYTTLFRSKPFGFRESPVSPITKKKRCCKNSSAFGRNFLKDRKSTRLNSSHLGISYAVFCLKKKKKKNKKEQNQQNVEKIDRNIDKN